MVRVNHNSKPICNPSPTALFGQVIQLFASTDEKLVFMSVKFAKISKFLVYYRHEIMKVFKRTSNAMICIPGSLLREINRY